MCASSKNKYLQKWIKTSDIPEHHIPLPTTPGFTKPFLEAKGGPSPRVQIVLKVKNKSKYHNTIGEIIYTMVSF